MVSYSLCWLSQKAAVLCWEKEVRVSGSEQTKNSWAESRGCGDWSISYKEELRELKLFILGKTRPRGQKLKQEISSEYGGKLLYCEGDWALEQSAQRDRGVSFPADIHNPAGGNPVSPAGAEPALEGGLDQIVSNSSHSALLYAPLHDLLQADLVLGHLGACLLQRGEDLYLCAGLYKFPPCCLAGPAPPAPAPGSLWVPRDPLGFSRNRADFVCTLRLLI